MRTNDFRKLLFKGIFSAMACDGEIHKEELRTLKAIVKDSILFEGLDYEQELSVLLAEIKQKGSQAIQVFFDELASAELTERQEMQLVEVLIQIVEADQKIDDQELHFMHHVTTAISVSETDLIVRFPRHVNLLIDLEHYGKQDIKTGLEHIDLSGIEGTLEFG